MPRSLIISGEIRDIRTRLEANPYRTSADVQVARRQIGVLQRHRILARQAERNERSSIERSA